VAGLVDASFIDADDIADVAVAALTEPGHAGRLYELTSPRLLTFADAVAEIAEPAAREIRYITVSVEDYVAGTAEHGVSADTVAPLSRAHLSLRVGSGPRLPPKAPTAPADGRAGQVVTFSSLGSEAPCPGRDRFHDRRPGQPRASRRHIRGAGSQLPQPGGLMMDEQARHAAFMSALVTEHFVLQSVASTTVSEAGSRASLYLFSLSSSLIAMGFTAQTDAFPTFVAALLPALFVLGWFTVVRLVDTSVASYRVQEAIARIRGFYRQLTPEARYYFPAWQSTDDEAAEALAMLGSKARRSTVLFTSAGMVAAINSLVGGVGVALLTNEVLDQTNDLPAILAGSCSPSPASAQRPPISYVATPRRPPRRPTDGRAHEICAKWQLSRTRNGARATRVQRHRGLAVAGPGRPLIWRSPAGADHLGLWPTADTDVSRLPTRASAEVVTPRR
jgi:hypothetical protein